MAWNPEDRDRWSIAERRATIQERLGDEPPLVKAEEQTLDMMELALGAIPTQDLLAEIERRVSE